MAFPLRVGVVTDGLTPQARWLLAGLMPDPAFEVRLLPGPGPRPEPLPALARLVLAAERALPPPCRLPLPEISLPRPDPVGAFDVMVDLTNTRPEAWQVRSAPIAAAFAGRPGTEAVLTSAGRVIARATYDTKPLASHNATYVAEKSAQMILRELKRRAQGELSDLGPLPGAGAVRGSTLGYLSRTLAKTADRLADRLALRRGRVRQGFGLRQGLGGPLDFDPAALRPIRMPPNALWADPFLIEHRGETWCFFEDYDAGVGRGHISAGRLTEAGLVDVQPALKQPHHMSYPFVLHHRGQILMMPEVHGARRLEVWRCTAFPHAWELHATAFEGTPVVDSVLFQRGAEWWLFTHIARDRFDDYCSDLHVFRLDGPELTGIVPHRLNPVVTDAATARGGGRIHGGARLLRLSQDNTGGHYGWGLNVMEITRLDLTHYEERRLRHVSPDLLGLRGCHHLDALNGRVVMDAR